jgi:acyl-CoA thioesterase FadM
MIGIIANSHQNLYTLFGMKPFRIVLVLLLSAGLMAALIRPAAAQSSDSQTTDSVYVTETGHWIWGEFLRTYNSVSDPLLYFGYPITDDFTDPVTHQHVQYFQKARFDLVDSETGAQVKIAPLGSLLHENGVPLADIPNEGPTCRAFSSGYSVCYAFLQFYDAYDGVNHFGSPISSLEVVNGRYVQYFEYARMEWWPEKAAGQRVVLSDLGRIYFDQVVADPQLLKSSPPANIAGSLLKPQVRVFARNALIGAGESQVIYVVVQDQYLRAMTKSQVGVTLKYPDQTQEFYRLPETNEFGISQFSFTVPEYKVKSVIEVEAEVTIRGETVKGSSWFRLWW